MREFQEDGRFSRDRYLRILKQVRLEPGSFETEMRRQLIRKKIEDLVKDGVKVSDAELQEAYSARNQRVRMAWASLDTTPLMAGVTVPDADLEPYVKAHQAQFTRPERRRIQYVIVSAPVPPQTVSDQDAQAYYDKQRRRSTSSCPRCTRPISWCACRPSAAARRRTRPRRRSRTCSSGRGPARTSPSWRRRPPRTRPMRSRAAISAS